MKLSNIAKIIGKRGCLGILLFLGGAWTFIAARSQANDLVETTRQTEGYDQYALGQALAHSAGYDSWQDYLTERNHKSGVFFMVSGALLLSWGIKKHGGKIIASSPTVSETSDKPADVISQTPPVDRPTMAEVVSEIKQSVKTIDPKAMAKGVVNESRVSNPLVKTLLIWFCRIFGLLGCVASIGMLVNAMNGKASQDDVGAGGSIVMFLVFAGLTACGFWKRKKKVV